MEQKVVNIINLICKEKGYEEVPEENSELSRLKLRDDLGFDSFDLAHLTVLVEEEFDVDIFEDGIIETIGEVFNKLRQ